MCPPPPSAPQLLHRSPSCAGSPRRPEAGWEREKALTVTKPLASQTSSSGSIKQLLKGLVRDSFSCVETSIDIDIQPWSHTQPEAVTSSRKAAMVLQLLVSQAVASEILTKLIYKFNLMGFKVEARLACRGEAMPTRWTRVQPAQYSPIATRRIYRTL